MTLKPTLPDQIEETLVRLECVECCKLLGESSRIATGEVRLQCSRCKSLQAVDLSTKGISLVTKGKNVFTFKRESQKAAAE